MQSFSHTNRTSIYAMGEDQTEIYIAEDRKYAAWEWGGLAKVRQQGPASTWG